MIRHTLIIAMLTVFAGALTTTVAQEKQSFKVPILITSAGQSADVTLAGSLCKKANLEAKALPSAVPADLKGVNTLLIVPGFSSKGLGAAGTSKEDEMQRVRTLIAAARSAKIPILVIHIGGMARRGTQSDDFNRTAVEAARHLIVVKQGNEDGFFTALAAEHHIRIEVVDKIAAVLPPLTAAFK
jgi:hypothetical protein